MIKYTSTVWTKSVTQQTIKQLRQAGLTVTKKDSGYECIVGDTMVFKAMNGTRGYLVRYDENLFA